MNKLSIIVFLFLFHSAGAQLIIEIDPNWKYGYRDTETGELVIPCIYDNAYNFHGNTALVYVDSSYYVINRSGKRILKLAYKHAAPGPVDDRYLYWGNGAMVVCDTLGKEIYKFKGDRFDRWGETNEPGIYVASSGNMIGIICTKGNTILPLEYETDDYLSTFHVDGNLYFYDNALFRLKHNGKWGIISMYGKVVLPFEYESLETVQYDLAETGLLFAAGTKDGKRVFVNSQKKNIELDFDTCPGFFNIMTQAVLLKGDKVIFYDVNKSAIVDSFPFIHGRDNQYGSGASGEESRALKIQYKGKYMIINTKKQVIYPFSDNPANPMYINGKVFFAVREKDKYMFALFDSKLKQITPFNFTDLNEYQDRIYATDGEQKRFILSTSGKLTPIKD